MEKKLTNIYNFVVALLMFFLPLSTAIPNILLLPITVLLFFKKNVIFWSSNYIRLAVAFSAVYLIKDLFYSNSLGNIIEYKFCLLLVLVLIIGINARKYIWLELGFVAGTLLAVLKALIKISNYYFINEVLPFGNTAEINNLISIDRPYFGFICVISILFLSKFMRLRSNKLEKQLLVFCQILLITFIYLIVARLALLMALFYFIVLFFRKSSLRNIKFYGMISIFFISIFFILKSNENIKKRFHINKSLETTINELVDYEPRFVIWPCGVEQWDYDNFSILFGFGNIAEVQKNLYDCYNQTIKKDSKKEYYLKTNFNMHNQFLDVFLKNGLVGFILFLGLCSFWFFRKKLNFLESLIIIFTVVFLLVENLLNRQLGTYLLIFLIPFTGKIYNLNND